MLEKQVEKFAKKEAKNGYILTKKSYQGIREPIKH